MRLNFEREWTIGESVGEGGFGRVLAATSPEFPSAVAKMVPKVPGAERELLFVDLPGVRNVVPIIDSGETNDEFVLIMPRADMSLGNHLDASQGSLELGEALEILMDIAVALKDLEGVVVHRDLKPQNILYLDGNWCVADFGISRYSEATTSPNTRKYALSAPYAGPERWRDERATSATDVYSFGIIAFELMSGHRPFSGPEFHNYREQHLHYDPPRPGTFPTAFAALVDQCLLKAPEARPKASTLVDRLKQIEEPVVAGLSQLQEAHRSVVAQRGEEARRESELRSEAERRTTLAESGYKLLSQISEELREAITRAAPSASLNTGSASQWSIHLNGATIVFGASSKTPGNPWGDWEPPVFDVLAHSTLSILIENSQDEYKGRSHSIWYCDAQKEGQFEWFETAFMLTMATSEGLNPFALDPCREAAKAFWSGVSEFQVAWPFTVLRVGNLDDFIGRWAGWLAEGARNELRHPRVIPERQPEGSWRST